MKWISDGRNRALVTITALAVTVAGLLLLGQVERSAPPEVMVAKPAAAERTGPASAGNAARGPGIPPAPGSTQNAPPDPNPGASTGNLKLVANALHLNTKSTTMVVTLPAGLRVTNRVDVSVLFDEGAAQAQRITQTYDNASGNRIVANLAANDGQRRRVPVVISLAEAIGNGDFVPFAIRSTVDLQPLYDITVSPLDLFLENNCDALSDSDVHIYWRYPAGNRRDASVGMSAGESTRIGSFAVTYREAGQSSKLGEPTFRFVEDGPDFSNAYTTIPAKTSTPLLPGKTRRISLSMVAGNDDSCYLKLAYRITYTLRQYPDL